MPRKAQIQVREADGSIKPGVERSGTPGKQARIEVSPRSGRQPCNFALSLGYLLTINDGFLIGYRPLRGLAAISFTGILGLTPQALCRRPLRGLLAEIFS